MTNPITGIINVTGEPDSGKTWFAFSSGATPERTAFIDDDLKGKAIVNDILASNRHLGFYRNLVKESSGMREIDFHNLCLRIIDEIKAGEYDVLIWDTWTRFENSFHPMVVSNPNKYRQYYSAMGTFKGAQQWQASFDYEASVLSTLTEKVPLVILTSHLKKDSLKRDVAESKKALVQKSRMRVWLRHSPDTPEPTGLVLKRLSKVDFSDGMKPINVTHRKIHPFTWENLLGLWENPVGNSAPSKTEELSDVDLSILDGILTEDQKDVLKLAVIEAQREERELQEAESLVQSLTSKRVNDGIDGDVNGDYPAIPKTAAEFYIQAQKNWGMTAVEIQAATDCGLDFVMKMGEKEIGELWETLLKQNQK